MKDTVLFVFIYLFLYFINFLLIFTFEFWPPRMIKHIDIDRDGAIVRANLPTNEI